MAEKKSRGWLTVVYPESAPADWFNRLSEVGMQALVSPLHEFDVNADGEIKKAHYHIILLWDGPTTYSNAKTYVDLIGGVGCLAMASLRGASRYLCHMDNPEKYQYSREDVRVLGGLDYDEYISSMSDDDLALIEMYRWIDEHHCYSWRQFNRYCSAHRMDWFRLSNRKCRNNLIAYMQSGLWEFERGESGLPIGFVYDSEEVN